MSSYPINEFTLPKMSHIFEKKIREGAMILKGDSQYQVNFSGIYSNDHQYHQQ